MNEYRVAANVHAESDNPITNDKYSLLYFIVVTLNEQLSLILLNDRLNFNFEF